MRSVRFGLIGNGRIAKRRMTVILAMGGDLIGKKLKVRPGDLL